MRARRVVIIGAGVGGLVAALRLAAQGLAVTLVEGAPTPGGKLRELVVDGAPIDVGPTVFTMRWVFDEIFAEVGASLADHVVLRPVETLARHAWGSAERLDLFADVARSAEAIGVFAGAREADGYLRFCRRARAVYATLRGPFIGASRPGPAELVRRVGLAGLGDLARISPFTTMWRALGGYFRDPRLRQLFGRYATYCGSSPFAAPATLMLVAHVEQDGVWIVEGGMHRLAAALAEAARARGAMFRFGARAARILVEGGRAAGVEIAGGERLPAEAIVMNGDIAALADGRLGPDAAGAAPRTPPSARSMSAVTWAIAARADGFPLLRHNVFFSRDYRAEFDDIFRRGRLPRRPTAYVCAQDRGDEGAAGAGRGRERLLCLVNAPPGGDRGPIESSELEACEEATFHLLSRCGLTIDRRTGATTRTTPADFERLFPSTGGALYGRASHGWMASFARPGSRTRLPGLYLAGGSVHPGPGVPMAALSGSQAAASIITDLSSTRRSIQAAMPGGMSTR